MVDIDEYLKTRVVADSKWLDWLVLSAMLISLTIVAKKALGGSSFKLGDTEIPTNYAWIVLSGLSVIHLYLACLIIRSSHKLWQDSSAPADTFLKLTAEGGILLRGLAPRITHYKLGETYIFKMPFSDLTVWPSYLVVVLMVAAIVPFSVNPFGTFYLFSLVGLLLAYINWRIAANWLVALSDLTLPKDESVYHARLGAASDMFCLVFQKTDSVPDCGPLALWFLIILDVFTLAGLFLFGWVWKAHSLGGFSRTAFYVLALFSISFFDFGKFSARTATRRWLVRLPLLALPIAYSAWAAGVWK